MFGVRRPGVTITAGALELAGLGDAACGCYGLLAEEYGKFINNLDTL